MSPVDLLADPAAVPHVLSRLRALSKLELHLSVNGRTERIPLRLVGDRAIFQATLESVPEVSGPELDPETIAWRDAITSAGGTFRSDSVALADALIKAIKASSFNSKVKYLLPLLGADLTAARMPLRDSLGVGMAASAGYVDADFSQGSGIQANGSSKYFDTLIKASQLGTSNNGGIGHWERGTANGDIFVGARAGSNIFELFFRKSVTFGGEHQLIRWGDVVNFAGSISGYAAGHYYGQRSASTLRTLYRQGASVFTNTTNDPATGAGTWNLFVCGASNNAGSPLYGIGRCAVTYLTDGTLTDAEAAAFHTLLQTYLITPTGR